MNEKYAQMFASMLHKPAGWAWWPTLPKSPDLALMDVLLFDGRPYGVITMYDRELIVRGWAGNGAIGQKYLGAGNSVHDMREAVQEWVFASLWNRPRPFPDGMDLDDLEFLAAPDLLRT